MATIKMVIFYYSIHFYADIIVLYLHFFADMSHLVKVTNLIYIGVPSPEEAPGTDSPKSKYIIWTYKTQACLYWSGLQ